MYALVGALVASPVFTSCVDDSESASVTAIRNAKAEQLKANAAYLLAQTEYQKAYAALQQAKAEEQLMINEQAKQEFVYEIESIKANYAKAIAEAKKTEMEALDAIKGYNDTRLTGAVTNYETALTAVNTLKQNILFKKADYAKIGLDSATNAVIAKNWLAAQELEIKNKTAQIEYLKKYDGETTEAHQAKIDELEKEANTLANEMAYATDAQTKASSAYTDALGDFDGIDNYNWLNGEMVITDVDEVTDYAKAIDELTSLHTWSVNTGNVQINISAEAGSYKINQNEYFYIKNFTAVLESEVLAMTQNYNAALKDAKDKLGSASTAADANDAKGGYIILEALEAAVKAAKDGMALETPTHDQDDVDAAEMMLALYKEDMTDYTRDYNNDGTVDAGFAYLQNEVKKAEEAIAYFNELLAKVKEGSDEHKAWVAAQEALLATAEAYAEANDKVTEISDLQSANGSMQTLLNSLITSDYLDNSTQSIAEQIAALEEDIEEIKANIEKYGMNDSDAQTLSTEEMKEMLKAEIAQLEEELVVKEKILAKYKAELDALLTEEA